MLARLMRSLACRKRKTSSPTARLSARQEAQTPKGMSPLTLRCVYLTYSCCVQVLPGHPFAVVLLPDALHVSRHAKVRRRPVFFHRRVGSLSVVVIGVVVVTVIVPCNTCVWMGQEIQLLGSKVNTTCSRGRKSGKLVKAAAVPSRQSRKKTQPASA